MAIRVYHYPNCSTCKKARKWLDERGVDYELVHLVEATPDAAALADLHARSGLEVKKFFNTSGNSYKAGKYKDRLPGMSLDEALAELAADGMLIKRPILDTGDAVLVGFRKPEAWADALA